MKYYILLDGDNRDYYGNKFQIGLNDVKNFGPVYSLMQPLERAIEFRRQDARVAFLDDDTYPVAMDKPLVRVTEICYLWDSIAFDRFMTFMPKDAIIQSIIRSIHTLAKYGRWNAVKCIIDNKFFTNEMISSEPNMETVSLMVTCNNSIVLALVKHSNLDLLKYLIEKYELGSEMERYGELIVTEAIKSDIHHFVRWAILEGYYTNIQRIKELVEQYNAMTIRIMLDNWRV